MKPSNNYQINGCPISSTNCVQFTSLVPPTNNPLVDLRIGLPVTSDDDDSLLPDVAEQDY